MCCYSLEAIYPEVKNSPQTEIRIILNPFSSAFKLDPLEQEMQNGRHENNTIISSIADTISAHLFITHLVHITHKLIK